MLNYFSKRFNKNYTSKRIRLKKGSEIEKRRFLVKTPLFNRMIFLLNYFTSEIRFISSRKSLISRM